MKKLTLYKLEDSVRHYRPEAVCALLADGSPIPALCFRTSTPPSRVRLADCTLVTFDQPGTGLATFDPDAGLNVSALADMTHSVADHLLPEAYFLAGASMGGLITLLQLRRYGVGRIEG